MEGWRKHIRTPFRWIGASFGTVLLFLGPAVLGYEATLALKSLFLHSGSLFATEVLFLKGWGFHAGISFATFTLAAVVVSLLHPSPRKYLSTLFLHKDEETKKKMDDFWKDHAYEIVQLMVVIGLGTLIFFAFSNPNKLLEASYFLIFFGASIAAAIATWRGRQFENQIQYTQLGQALEMVTEKGNYARNFLGFDLLKELNSLFPIDNYPYIRDVFLSGIKIDKERREAFGRLRNKMRREEGGRLEARKFADRFPPESTLQFFFKTLQRGEIFQTPSPEHSMYVGKEKVMWPENRLRSEEGFALPYIEIQKVAYVLPSSGDEGYTAPIHRGRISLRSCFYYENLIENSILRGVNFAFSIIMEVTFYDTDLEGTRFNYCILNGTRFGRGANLKNTSFDRANISRCNFTRAEGLHPEQFQDAFWIGDAAPKDDSVLRRRYFLSAPEFPPHWNEDKFWEKEKWNSLDDFIESLRRGPLPSVRPSRRRLVSDKPVADKKGESGKASEPSPAPTPSPEEGGGVG